MEREKNPELQFAIDRLLEIHSLPDASKADLLLVFLDLKPASSIQLGYQEGSQDYTKSDFENDIKQLENITQILGLKSKISYSATDENKMLFAWFMVAKDESRLNNLINAFTLAGTPEYDVAMGKALGIPDTAIESFTQKSFIKKTELPPDAAEEFDLANFMPSKEHWHEELEIMKKRNHALKTIAPKLFSR